MICVGTRGLVGGYGELAGIGSLLGWAKGTCLGPISRSGWRRCKIALSGSISLRVHAALGVDTLSIHWDADSVDLAIQADSVDLAIDDSSIDLPIHASSIGLPIHADPIDLSIDASSIDLGVKTLSIGLAIDLAVCIDLTAWKSRIDLPAGESGVDLTTCSARIGFSTGLSVRAK